MYLTEQKPVGRAYGVQTERGWQSYANGLTKTYASKESAQRAADKIVGAQVRMLYLSVEESLQPVTADRAILCGALSTVQDVFKSGKATVHKWLFELSDETNIVRLRPLGEPRVDQVGDVTAFIKFSAILSVDMEEMRLVYKAKESVCNPETQ